MPVACPSCLSGGPLSLVPCDPIWKPVAASVRVSMGGDAALGARRSLTRRAARNGDFGLITRLAGERGRRRRALLHRPPHSAHRRDSWPARQRAAQKRAREERKHARGGEKGEGRAGATHSAMKIRQNAAREIGWNERKLETREQHGSTAHRIGVEGAVGLRNGSCVDWRWGRMR